jgi:ABC-type nitrate/sulfonate/bicarbonate transport system ATPase subunit
MQRNPNTIKASVPVEFSRPREAYLRTVPEFIEFRKHLAEVMGSDTGENS